MKRYTVLSALLVSAVLTACGGGGSSSGNGDVASARSQLCSELSGLEAVYWDFINGVIRTDLPTTAFTIPFNVQGSYTHARSPLLGFLVPQGWTVFDARDQSGFAFAGTEVGADLIRDDNQAVWRYMLSAEIGGDFTAMRVLNADINTALSFLGTPSPIQEQCEINLQQNGILGLESVAAKVVRAGDYTIMARIHITLVTGVSNYYDGYLSVARTTDHPAVINDIFVPMITQLYGGGSDPEACEDGEDNDNDGLTDFGQDPQCDSPSDDNEAS
ncbi:MAG TPA: hypothetical protein DD979_14365 [Gammaproteobacteria bacterium]|jgi:hypothetical protein|nr:hypothetical protein [Gammaproteobacteria bacterium]